MERLQKLLAQAGIASRRRAEEMIVAGRVRVNGQVVTELGAQADPERDTIMVDNQPVTIETKAYYVLNKPRGYISDRDDTAENKTALDLVPDGRRLFAAGRLDLTSEGMLLLMNDGELANRLTHPRYEHEKEYLVLVYGMPDDKVMERLHKGILYDGEWMRADSAERAGRSQTFGEAGRDETWLRIVLHEGKKRQIRHMCAALGHPVKRLIRVRIGPLNLGNLKVGEWRKLSRDEMAQLWAGAKPRAQENAKPSKRRERQNPAKSRGENTSNARREARGGERQGGRQSERYERRKPAESRGDASNVKRETRGGGQYRGQERQGPGGSRGDAPNAKREPRGGARDGGGQYKRQERGKPAERRGDSSYSKRGSESGGREGRGWYQSQERRGPGAARGDSPNVKRDAGQGPRQGSGQRRPQKWTRMDASSPKREGTGRSDSQRNRPRTEKSRAPANPRENRRPRPQGGSAKFKKPRR